MKSMTMQVVSALKKGKDDVRLANSQPVRCPRVSTQSYLLDIALGGGVPLGRIIEIYGDSGCGKTTISLHLLSQIQRRKGLAVFIDTENSLDIEYASRILDTSDLIYLQPDTGEQMFDFVRKVLSLKFANERRRRSPGLIVVDSVAGVIPSAELDDIDSSSGYSKSSGRIGLQARLMSSSLKTVTGLLRSSNTSLILLNQVRVKIARTPFASGGVDTPGGKAIKFYSSVRIELTQAGFIRGKKSDEFVGHVLRTMISKNKTFVPRRKAELVIKWGYGIDREQDLISVAKDLGVVVAKGSWHSWRGKKWNGEESFIRALKSDRSLFESLTDEVEEKISF